MRRHAAAQSNPTTGIDHGDHTAKLEKNTIFLEIKPKNQRHWGDRIKRNGLPRAVQNMITVGTPFALLKSVRNREIPDKRMQSS